jgi:hypothetical protein
MPSLDRRAAARRRAWGRGPMILRFEPLEGRQLMAANLNAAALPDLISTAFSTPAASDWNTTIEASGAIKNNGTAQVPPGAIAGIYASPTQVIGPGSVLIGVVTINAGLQPGATQPYDEQVTLPPSPLPGMGATDNTLFLGVRIDPQGVIPELNNNNKEGLGRGIDQSVLTITPDRPSNLIGTSFGLSTPTTTWGQTITAAAQITNNAQGDAPATRAKVVLTPNGQAPGGANDVTVGSIMVPAIPAFQTTNVTQAITLPAGPPTSLAGQGAYLISIIQDAGHDASTIVKNTPVQGLGLDTAVLTIGDGANAGVAKGPLPDLAATGVITPGAPIHWGQTFQVTTAVQNIGKGNAGEFTVTFLLTGANGAVSPAIYLGETKIGSLNAGFTQNIIQSLTLPSRLPFGYNIASITTGRIIAIVDQENTVDEAVKTNNSATSAPITLQLLGGGANATVPTSPPVRTNQPTPTPTPVVLPKTPVVPRKPGKYKLPAKKKTPSALSQVTNYPKTIFDFFKNALRKPAPKRKRR